MFLGNYNSKMDDKGRIILPVDMRKNIEEDVMLTVVNEFSLLIKDSKGWKAEEVFKGKENYITDHVNKYTFRLQIDKQGRINVPNDILDKLKIGKDIIVIGHGDFIELTDYNKYLEFQEYRKTI